MIYASRGQKFRVFAILFSLLAATACVRETPRQPMTSDEEAQDAAYLTELYNTRAINTLGAKSDDSGSVEQTDYNRTRGRTSYRDYWRNREFRLNMVGYRILEAAYPLCPHKLKSRSMMVGVAARARTHPVIEWAITPFDQMDIKTLKLGDEILAMGSQDIPVGLQGTMRARSILADYANRLEPLRFYVKRANKDDDDFQYLHITQVPQNFCNYEFVIESNNQFNAFADDKTIHVNSKTLSMLNTDDELAFVIGHETAHNVMRHVPKERILHVLQFLAQIFTWKNPNTSSAGAVLTDDAFSRQFEDEADYIGVYFAAASGYDPAGALSAMQIIARVGPDEIHDNLLSDHPATAERYTQLRKAIEQIKIKQAQGLPVMPDFD